MSVANNIISPEQRAAQLAATYSRAQRYFLAQTARLDVETQRRIGAQSIKFIEAAFFHKAIIKDAQSGGIQNLVRNDAQRRPGISVLQNGKLAKGVNMAVERIGFRYGQLRVPVGTAANLTDEQIENSFAAYATYTSQGAFPNLTNLDFQRTFNAHDSEFVSMIPPALRNAEVAVLHDGNVVWTGLIDEFLMASWNSTADLKKRGSSIELDTFFMLFEDKPIDIQLKMPQRGPGAALPAQIQFTSTDVNAPAGVQTLDLLHFAEFTFYGPSTHFITTA